MLEAQVSIRPSAADPSGVNRQGDVLVLALPDHPWGRLDKVRLLVVEWDDPEQEKLLIVRRDAGEDWPVRTVPYIQREGKKVVRRSAQVVDVLALAQADAAVDPSQHVGTISLDGVSLVRPGLAERLRGFVSRAWSKVVG